MKEITVVMNMNNHKFIDSTTYEIIPDENIIEVDPDIALAISLLNQKGYKTIACCSGHAFDLTYYKQVKELSLLDEEKIKEEYPEYYIVGKTDLTFTLITPKVATCIYVMFAKDYHFASLPVDFVKETNESDCIIRKRINYYENHIRRNPNDVEKEIKKYNNLLLKWVRKLPKMKERNDE